MNRLVPRIGGPSPPLVLLLIFSPSVVLLIPLILTPSSIAYTLSSLPLPRSLLLHSPLLLSSTTSTSALQTLTLNSYIKL